MPEAAGKPRISIELAMGVAIEAHRLERRMSLPRLAQATKIPAPLLADYEAGVTRAGGGHVLAIADALQISVGALFRLHASFPSG
jgi:transcriptional regulator with XRE-family HTH domain